MPDAFDKLLGDLEQASSPAAAAALIEKRFPLPIPAEFSRADQLYAGAVAVQFSRRLREREPLFTLLLETWAQRRRAGEASFADLFDAVSAAFVTLQLPVGPLMFLVIKRLLRDWCGVGADTASIELYGDAPADGTRLRAEPSLAAEVMYRRLVRRETFDAIAADAALRDQFGFANQPSAKTVIQRDFARACRILGLNVTDPPA